jgi:hypothetical protein
VEPIVVREDVNAILVGLFDLNARVLEIGVDVAAIREFLEDGDGEEEAEGD